MDRCLVSIVIFLLNFAKALDTLLNYAIMKSTKLVKCCYKIFKTTHVGEEQSALVQALKMLGSGCSEI